MKSLKQKIDHIISYCEAGMPRRELLLAMERLDKAKCEYETISNPEILDEKNTYQRNFHAYLSDWRYIAHKSNYFIKT